MGKQRFVIDTNVLLSAMAASINPCGAKNGFLTDLNLYRHVLRRGQIYISHDTWKEFVDIALDPDGSRDGIIRHGPASQLARMQFVADLGARARMVEPAKAKVKCCDLKDQMFLNVAAAAAANFIITHDKDLRILRQSGSCRILTPQAYLDELAGAGPNGKPKPLQSATPV